MVYAWNEKDPNDPNDGYWEPTLDRKFVWYNWLLLEELDALDGNAIVRTYTWGLDLAGQNGSLNDLESAGGTLDPIASRQGQVGGLLALHDPDDDGDPNDPNDIERNYVYLYDATLDMPSARQGQASNVGQLIDWENSGNLVAKYEYDPYGNNLLDADDPNEGGPYASDNPFRFSTKYFDDETGLGYWGYRYYSLRLGRWLSRDPIGEEGGPSLYGLLRNSPTSSVDPLGLLALRIKTVSWTVSGAGCNVTVKGSAEVELDMAIPVVRFFMSSGLKCSGSVSASFTNTPRTACNNRGLSSVTCSAPPPKVVYRRRWGVFVEVVSIEMKASCSGPGASSSVSVSVTPYGKWLLDAGVNVAQDVNASVTLKEWTGGCCGCLETEAELSCSYSGKLNATGTGAAIAIGIAVGPDAAVAAAAATIKFLTRLGRLAPTPAPCP